MVKTVSLDNYSDVHFTDPDIAKLIIQHFSPSGRILEPFKGSNSFYDHLPKGTEWCEITEGRCFFKYNKKVDYIVTNPPFSNLTDIMKHAFEIADNTVFFLPLSKITSSAPRMELIRKMAGIKEIFMFGSGRSVGFDIGFPFSAIHFKKGYRGPISMKWHADDLI